MAGYSFTYSINGTDHTLTDGTNTFVLGASGLSGVQVDLPMQRRPYADGARLMGVVPTLPTDMRVVQDWGVNPYVYTAPREIQIAVGMKDTTLADWESRMRTLMNNVTPYENATAYQGPVLIVTAPTGTAYTIEGRIVEISGPEMDGPTYGVFIVTFLAPNPFFHLAFGAGNKTTMDANPDSITNTGDTPLYPDIWVTGSASTTIVNLHLINATTGKLWSTTQTMAINSWLRVNMLTCEATYSTDAGATYTDITGTTETDAEFWSMPVGTNSIQWSSKSGTPAAIDIYHAWNHLAI